MDTFLKKLFEIDKTPTKVLVLVAVISGGLLFLPPPFLERLKLTGFEQQYGINFGISFLISAGMVLINIGIWTINQISRKIVTHKLDAQIFKSVASLDPKEKAVLREFYLKGQQTLSLPCDDAVVSGLISNNIITQVSAVGRNHMVGMLFPMKISKIAIKYVNPADLGLIQDANEHQKNQIIGARPKWAKDLDAINRLF